MLAQREAMMPYVFLMIGSTVVFLGLGVSGFHGREAAMIVIGLQLMILPFYIKDSKEK
jgi:hypothetical protein